MATELGDLALFLAHVAPFYPNNLAYLPDQIGVLLDTNARAALGPLGAPRAGADSARQLEGDSCLIKIVGLRYIFA
jgi:hypothetical protein